MALALLFFWTGAACALDTWDGTTGTGFAGGDGSPGNPYQIATGAQLAYLAKQVRDASANYSAKSYKLTGDIDLAGYEWPIIIGQGYDMEFKGVFDGGNHKILNFRCTGYQYSAGLFGWVKDATIQNVHLVGAHIAPTPDGTITCNVGGIAGVANAGSTIEGCSVMGSITGGNANGDMKDSCTGGIVGVAAGTVKNCSFMGTVTGGNAAGTSSNSSTGGIAGGVSGNVLSACSAGGSVVGGDGGQNSYTGGIAGFVGRVNGKISNCSSTNSVAGGKGGTAFSCTGGVVGTIESDAATPAVEKSYSFGSVTAGGGTGTSITGVVVGFAFQRISGCYWNKTVNTGATVGVGQDNLGGTEEANAVGLAAAAFATGSNFDKDQGGTDWTDDTVKWKIGNAASAWFYPTFDTSRPRLKTFFDATGDVLSQFASASLTPNAVIIKAGDPNATVTVSVLDGLSFAISGVSPANLGGASLSYAGNKVTVTPGATTTAAGPETIKVMCSVNGGVSVTATFSLTVLAGTTGGGNPTPATGVTLDKSTLTLIVGGSGQLTPTVAPANATTKTVTWKSSDEAVATADANGRVTAVGPGTATITVTTTDGGKTATCAVTVTGSIPTTPVSGITLNPAAWSMKVGTSYSLTATVTPAGATNKGTTWKSNNTTIATVDANGKVTAVGPGTAVITVTTADGGKTATCTVTVAAQATVVTIDLSDLGLVNGVLELESSQGVDVTLAATPAGTAFGASGLPEGLTLSLSGRLRGAVPQPGTYTVTLTATAPDGTQKTQTFIVRVTEDTVIVEPEQKSGSGGGCSAAGLGLAALALGAMLPKRR